MRRLSGTAVGLITMSERPIKAFSHIIVLLSCIFLSEELLGQPSPPSNLLPTIISPSPEVAAFARFGNYEVNLFNGTPNISIPIYEINAGELKVPITLTYNASGIRVNDIPGNVGTGWSVNAGGAITRKVMGGMPDEYNVAPANAGYFGYLNGGTVKNLVIGSAEELEYFREITDRHRIDTEPDIFSYNLPGKSGKFLFLQEDSLKPFLIPYEPLQISNTITGPSTMNLNITDESGINYQFNDKESSTYSLQSTITSSWLLSKMTSSNDKDVISFNYSNAPNLTLQLPNDNITVIDAVYSNCSNGLEPYSPTPGQTPTSLYNYNTISQKNLETIVFKNGKIVFQLAPEDRLDLGLTGLKKRMQKILIYASSGSDYTLIKQIEFYHSYFFRNDNSTNSKRLKLDRIVISDGAGASMQTYNFEYNNPTDNYGLPDKNAKAIDYWGYYNGKFQSTLVPRTDISYTPTANSTTQNISIGASTYGTRDPAPAFMQAGMLTKITYPTGGYSLFTYETNQYGTNPPVTIYNAGGLRIKKIESYDGISATPLTKTYVYGQNESGYGVKNFVLENFYFQTRSARRYWALPDGLNYVQCAGENIRTFLANPTNDTEPWDAAPVVYPYVTEYTGDGTANTGKVVYQFDYQPDNVLISQFMGGSPFILSNHYHRGQILFKTTYRKNADNSYAMVAQTENHYSAFPDVQKNYSALSVTHNLYSDGPTRFGQDVESQLPPANEGFYGWNGSMEYMSFYYPIQTGDKKLTETIERIYDQNDPLKVLATTTNYSYNNFNHQQATSTTTTNSKGEVIERQLKYPHDFVGQQPYTDMVNVKHMWSPVVEQLTYKNPTTANQFLQSTRTNYDYWYAGTWGNNSTGSIIVPRTAEAKTLNVNNAYDTRLRYHSYDDNGNVTTVSKENDAQKVYVWGYNKTYPVAEVVGASYSSVMAVLNQTILNNPADDATLRTELNKIRTNFPSAQVTTYTYRPLVGMTSQTDVNGRTTYFVYDAFNRLAFIKDKDGNVVKKFCYNYQDQSGNCSIYGNVVKSQSFTRNNCPSGQTGGSVTFTVPANTYYASTQTDADALAQADVNANGQNYANTNGSCTAAQVTVSGYNYGNVPYQVIFSGSSGTYNLYLYPSSSSSSISMPQGTYNVTFYPYTTDGVSRYLYASGSSTYAAGQYTFSNISISSGSYVQIGY
ncbi:DUF5977 domain-containing protein [Terrimonas pollutisoli]|uniref:DUF5977 domain-containing protein n=1 Tax=Terrimonas pollutisoli TaxID=3034147 RepID=UPI0023ED50DB|nr:DUF5977 domain-containing protein [Terrimonas sp. H1YJ31]